MSKINGRKRSSNTASRFFKQMTLLILVFLLGYMTASIEHGTHLKQWFMVQWLDQHVATSSFSTQQAALPQPKFEFYTLLAKESADHTNKPVLAEVKPALKSQQELITTAMVKNKIPETSPASNPKEAYLVQLASFRHLHEADRLKAVLVMKGFTVNIASVNQQGMPWYRVVMGPFTSKNQAQQAQSECARQEHLMGMVRRVDV